MKIKNVIKYPHIVATFMHHRFNIFREEVIQKYLKAKDLWYGSVLLNLFSIHCQFLIMVQFIFFVVTLYSFSLDMSGNIEVQHISMVSYGCKELLTWKDWIGQMIVIYNLQRDSLTII